MPQPPGGLAELEGQQQADDNSAFGESKPDETGKRPSYNPGKDGYYPSGDRSFEIGEDRIGRGGMFGEEDFTPTIVVSVDASGEVQLLRANLATVSEDNLSQIAEAVLSQKADSGRLKSYQLRYLRKAAEDGSYRIALADSSSELSRLESQALSSLAVGVPALVLLFFISLGLSALALRPVQRSMEQQKQFVADASHELKTPLTVILTNNDIMLRHPSATVASQRQWLESTRDEGLRMRSLIENLLFLAKSDADRLPLTLARINLSDLAEETLLTFEPVAFEQGILMESDITPSLELSADAAQMKQLMLILLDNAVKYSAPQGTVKVRLFAEAGLVNFSVNNHGEVIAPEVIPHLFERFYRTDAARSHSETGGYGLGLAIAQTITQLHQGKITCTSTEDDGTTFTVSLPLKKG